MKVSLILLGITILFARNHSAEFTVEWQQQEYTIMESAGTAAGIVLVTFPSGGIARGIEALFTYQDISASGGEEKKLCYSM